jgi:integrase
MPKARLVLNFTKAALDALPTPTGRRDYYNDTKLRGLQLVVTEGGSKTFYLYVRNNRKPLRLRLGTYPGLTLERARKKAEAARGRAAMDIDLRAERHAERQGKVTLDDAYKAYCRDRSTLASKTLYDYGRYFEVAFKDWHSRPLAEITKDMIDSRHRRLGADRGLAYADGAMRFLRAVINHARIEFEAPDGTPLLPDNPVNRLTHKRVWNHLPRRKTYIKPTQLRAWFEAVLELKADPEDREACTVADWLLLMVLTGFRRNEALRLPWADIDLDNRSVMTRDTKNGEDHTLPLSDYLLELLKARRQQDPEAIYVFASYGKQGYMIDPRRPLKRVIDRSGVTFTPHDLRRTFITIAESLDIPAYALKRLLNHKMRQDVTAGYIITDVERLRRPMQQVSDFILRSAGLRQTAQVEPFPTEARR